jgi:hypothetical protein
MPLLFSNNAPLRTLYKSYPEAFRSFLANSDTVKIASGYISTDSAIDLKNIVEANNGPNLMLCVGMHYFDGLAPSQLDALRSLNFTLKNKGLGRVFIVTTFPFHGKVSSFMKNGVFLGSIVGSSNLSNIIDGQRQYEADYLMENPSEASEVDAFITNLIDVSSQPLDELRITPVEQENVLLKDQMGVKRLKDQEIASVKNRINGASFDIPLKGDISQKSGLNASFGKGRENQQGFAQPRSWYEVELIVSKNITDSPDYPKANTDTASFEVVTDDGWSFRCKVSGDYSKNMRSEQDLKTLGRWIKGRLENAGVLHPGERVTDETLKDYGRDSMKLSKTDNPDQWFLDFGVNNE